MKNYLLTVAVLFAAVDAALSNGAVAADNNARAGNAWAGPYVGIHAGYLDGEVDVDVTVSGSSWTNKPSGVIGGALAGYNFAFDRWILGVEADVGTPDAEDSGDPFPTVDYRSEILVNGHLRLRAGYSFDRFMIFGAGGLALADYMARVWSNIGPPVPEIMDHDLIAGYSVGGGLEFLLTDNLNLRVEYLYDNYGKNTANFLPGAFDQSHDVETHTVRTALSWHMNGSSERILGLMTDGDNNWTGGYVGAHAGYLAGYSDVRVLGAAVATYWTNEPDGFVGGALAGYNKQYDHAVVGIEGDFGFIDAKHAGDPFSTVDYFSSFNWNGHVRGRIGYATGQYLFFIAAGLAVTEYEAETKSLIPGGSDPSDKDVLVGLTIGGGLEFAASDTISVRAEYLFDHYGQTIANFLPGAFDQTRYDIESHTGRIAVIWKLN